SRCAKRRPGIQKGMGNASKVPRFPSEMLSSRRMGLVDHPRRGEGRRMKPLAGHQPAAMVATPGASEAPAGVPDVDVVVVNWNTRELLRECLLSLRRQVTGCRVDISVIDNASRDGSPDMVRRDFPGARLVANQRNVG